MNFVVAKYLDFQYLADQYLPRPKKFICSPLTNHLLLINLVFSLRSLDVSTMQFNFFKWGRRTIYSKV